jgi:ABC-type antimicrobial peptide transport system permease subunit
VQMIDGRLTAKPETVMAPIARDMARYSALVRMAALPVTAALFLAVVGIYGLTRFTTAQRAHEIAIRVACGARPVEVIRLFAGSLLRPFVGGIVGGSALAGVAVWGLRRSALALDLPPADPLALALAVSLLSVATLMATVIPALRAARNDPWSALKE